MVEVEYRGEKETFVSLRTFAVCFHIALSIIFLDPQEISSMIVVETRETAEAYLGTAVEDAAVTVPAYFNDSQCQVVKYAGIVAIINVLQNINGLHGCSHHCGLDKKDKFTGEKDGLIFDLGEELRRVAVYC